MTDLGKQELKTSAVMVLGAAGLILFVLLAGCSSPELKLMCTVQEDFLAKYVSEANPHLSAEWQTVGEKLVRNQRTISKLAGVANDVD